MRRLPKSLSGEALKAAWSEGRDSRPSKSGAAGIDGVTANIFSGALNHHISTIRNQLQNNSFSFSKLRIAPIPKPNGGHRIIAIPTVRDRLLQRAILKHLEHDAKFKAASKISFGFTKGRTLSHAQMEAVKLRNQHPWVLSADIVKFFDEINRANLKGLIRKNVRCRIVSEILCAAVDCELDESSGLSKIAIENGIQKGRGLRQGMPVSPMLSNLVLRKFDEAIIQKHIKAIRYADDIIIFADSKNECRDALKFIISQLSKIDLKIPDLSDESKTTIRGPSEAVEFLGVEIRRSEGDKYTLHLPDKKFAKIDSTMASYATVSSCFTHKRNIGHVVKYLDSFTAGYRSAMQVLTQKEEFGYRLEAMKRSRLESLLIEILGKETFSGLNEKHLAILGVRDFGN